MMSVSTSDSIEGRKSSAVGSSALSGKHKRRVVFTSAIGNLIEVYDFAIYGIAAALVFPAVFFPELSSSMGKVAAFATFGVAFVARPLGGVYFGHLGDRLGRKKTLVATLLVMGVATVCIGLLPPTSQIGIAAPIILVLLRFMQGFAAGGEWAGANLFAAEHAPKAERGRWAMFPQVGSALAFGLGNATFLIASLGMDEHAFQTWGWRIPFVVSAVMVIVGLYIRLKIEETPVFQKAVNDAGISRSPIVDAVKQQPRQILLASGLGLIMGSYYYISATYMTTFAMDELDFSRNDVLGASIVGGVFLVLGAVASGLISDRIPRRKLLAVTNIIAVVWSLLMFPILGVGTIYVFAACICITLFISGFISSPLGAFLPEQFHTRHRYSASAVSYNVSAMLGGSIPPLIAPGLVSSFGPMALGGFLAAYGAVAAACTLALKDARTVSLDEV